MSSPRTLFIIALSLIALGVASFAMQPVLDPKPDPVCVDKGQPSSGFVDGDNKDCNISQASYEKMADWDSSPKPFRIAGVVLILAGIVVGAIGAVRSRRGAPPSSGAAPI